MPHILIAPDKFKGTLTATEVAREIANAITRHLPAATLKIAPMADGGEGTAQIIASRHSLTPHTIPGHNALMQPTDITYYTDNHTCAIDCASIIGLAMLGATPLAPWQTSSYPLGQFIRQMLRQGHTQIVIGLGGSATIDAGAGMLQALGARFFTRSGSELPTPPQSLRPHQHRHCRPHLTTPPPSLPVSQNPG